MSLVMLKSCQPEREILKFEKVYQILDALSLLFQKLFENAMVTDLKII